MIYYCLKYYFNLVSIANSHFLIYEETIARNSRHIDVGVLSGLYVV